MTRPGISLRQRFAHLFREVLKPIRERHFTYDAYATFLERLCTRRDVTILPLREMAAARAADRILVGLRHDVDLDLESALTMARLEHDHGVRSTFYILHSAPYYGAVDSAGITHQPALLDSLLELQNRWGHEVGLHNDMVTMQVLCGLDTVALVRAELAWLRAGGLDVVGVVSHGSEYCNVFGYHNDYFFEELAKPRPRYPCVDEITIGGNRVAIQRARMRDLGLSYDAYRIPRTHAFSDSGRPDGQRWHTDLLPLPSLSPADRVIVATHPVHWGRSAAQKYRRMARRFVEKRRAPRLA